MQNATTSSATMPATMPAYKRASSPPPVPLPANPPVMALLLTCLTQSQANLMSSSCSGVGCFSDTHVNSICRGRHGMGGRVAHFVSLGRAG